MTELSLSSPASPLSPGPRPHRRSVDQGLRQLFTPKNFIVVLMTISGLVFAAGKWLGAREHDDATLGRQIAGVSKQVSVLDARTSIEKLDQRYVTYDALRAEVGLVHTDIAVQKADLEWIKGALIRLENTQGQSRGRGGK